jgi:hypothetical protein
MNMDTMDQSDIAVRVFLDGTEFCALIGSNLMEGIAGFGQTRSTALRALADELDNAGEQQRDRKAA